MRMYQGSWKAEDDGGATTKYKIWKQNYKSSYKCILDVILLIFYFFNNVFDAVGIIFWKDNFGTYHELQQIKLTVKNNLKIQECAERRFLIKK